MRENGRREGEEGVREGRRRERRGRGKNPPPQNVCVWACTLLFETENLGAGLLGSQFV